MKTEMHPANERGHANHGWLDTWHSFSFAEYFNPVREHFGALRVLNDDYILGGSGFGEHPHNNMEIISIPLKGKLEHRDSMGHVEVISPGDVQVMSAGSGIRHSEYNHSASEVCNFLQVWIYTRDRNTAPRYDQQSFDPSLRNNALQLLVKPDHSNQQGVLWIQQDAWISITRLDAGNKLDYALFRNDNCVFCFVIEGEAMIANEAAGKRDAVAISQAEKINIEGNTNCEVLIIEVPEK
jgi:quercetin 2,3-dioxygenase